jgi:hypothetical protein
MVLRIRRLTALLASFLLVHLLWAGSGFACGMPGDAQASAAMAGMEMPGVEMPGMNMPGMDMSGTDMPRGPSPADAMPGDGGSEHHHAPCDLPWVPDGCQSMTPCAPLALTAHAEAFAPPAVPFASITPLVVLAPPSRALTPESPPPRA